MPELLEAARRGDSRAHSRIQELIRVFARDICRRTGPHHADLDWEDVAQEAARKFFSVGLAQYQGKGSSRSYLYAIVRSTAIHIARNILRRQSHESALPPAPHVPPHDPGPAMDTHRILSALPADCGAVLSRLYLYGLGYPEIAAELGMAESSVRSKVSRCLQKARAIAGRV